MSTPGSARATAELGRRDANKLQKRDRIRAAAADLFQRHGYAATTMRQIAQSAHVGLGTLFNYAEDKRDLVFLIFNEELAVVAERAMREPRPGDALVEQVMAVFRVHYRFFGSRPELSRILLQELTFYSTGKQADEFIAIRRRLIDGVERLVRAAQQDGRIRSPESPVRIARHFFFVYSAAIRWWIGAARPNIPAGIAELDRLLELQVGGLAPAPVTRLAGALKRRSAPSRASP